MAAEAFGTAAEPPEPGALLPVGVQNANRHIDGDLVDLAEDEVVLAGFEGVAGGVAGGERSGKGAAAAQFGGLGGQVGGCDLRDRENAQKCEDDSAEAYHELTTHQLAPIALGRAEGPER